MSDMPTHVSDREAGEEIRAKVGSSFKEATEASRILGNWCGTCPFPKGCEMCKLPPKREEPDTATAGG